MGQLNFWDLKNRHATLEQKKELLVQLERLVPWKHFQPLLNKVHEKPRKSSAGRKAINVIVNDCLSFMRFLGLVIDDKVPDATTVWLFHERLSRQGLIESLFEQFNGYLRTHGYEAKGEQIVDATLILSPSNGTPARRMNRLNKGISQSSGRRSLISTFTKTLGKALRSISIERAQSNLALTNLIYNLKRFVFWQVQSTSMAG